VAVERGVGRAWGVPALKKGGLLRPPGGSAGEGRDVPGLGPEGFYADGAPLAPLALLPGELLNPAEWGRRGFWSSFEFADLPRRDKADPAGRFRAHLEFLRLHGVPGGACLRDPGQAAELLGAYLPELAEHTAADPAAGKANSKAAGRVLVLSPRRYYETYLREKLPPPLAAETGEGSPAALSPAFRGLGLCCYENLPPGPRPSGAPWDILLLVNPEALLAGEGSLRRLRGLETRLRLGILFDASYVREGGPNPLKTFFGLRWKQGGKTRELGPLAFRDPNTPFVMPRTYPLLPPAVLKAPAPFGEEEGDERTLIAGGGRFVIRTRFSLLSGPEYKEEQERFYDLGPEVPPAPWQGPFRDPDFRRLDRERRDYFFYWRAGFRENRLLPADGGYVYLYAKELILAMGKETPEGYFQELLKLWRAYRGALPELDEDFPRWLVDFAVLYRIPQVSFPLLDPFRGDLKNRLPLDLYLHRRYIEEDRPLLPSDIREILKGSLLAPGILPVEAADPEGALVREADRYLRRRYGKGLFAFFYPSRGEKQEVEAFRGLSGLGRSSYTAEWIPISGHRPLIAFLERLFRPPQNPAGPFPRGEALFEAALGLGLPPEAPPRPSPAPSPAPEPPPGPFRLEAEKLARLREESGQVRELLRVSGEDPEEDPGEEPREAAPGKEAAPGETPPHEPPASPPVSPGTLGDFLSGLKETEKEALARILRGGETLGRDLAELARKSRTPPETLIDGINEAFRERFGDLLVDTLDGGPLIQAEYEEALESYFG
jgi:hypothetical protein